MSKQRHDQEPTSSKTTMAIMAVGGLLVAGLVAWALTRTVDTTSSTPPTATFAESPATNTFTSPDTSTLGATSTTSAPITTPLTPPRVITEENAGTEEEKAAVKRIAVEDLRAKANRGEVTIVDVRSASDYAMGHVPGALNIPLASIEAQLDRLPKNKPIVTYCTWPNEESSAGAALILQHKGYANVQALYGGFHSWQNQGYPTATGAE